MSHYSFEYSKFALITHPAGKLQLSALWANGEVSDYQSSYHDVRHYLVSIHYLLSDFIVHGMTIAIL